MADNQANENKDEIEALLTAIEATAPSIIAEHDRHYGRHDGDVSAWSVRPGNRPRSARRLWSVTSGAERLNAQSG